MPASCKASALRFLKIRPRSVEELRDKLSNKGFDAQEVSSTLDYLQGIKLLDDRAFTASWIRYRLARPFGFRRIITELKTKGVAPEIIQEAVQAAQDEYSVKETIEELANRRLKRLGGIEPQKKKKRLADFLIRRGFAMDEVMKVIKKLC